MAFLYAILAGTQCDDGGHSRFRPIAIDYIPRLQTLKGSFHFGDVVMSHETDKGTVYLVITLNNVEDELRTDFLNRVRTDFVKRGQIDSRISYFLELYNKHFETEKKRLYNSISFKEDVLSSKFFLYSVVVIHDMLLFEGTCAQLDFSPIVAQAVHPTCKRTTCQYGKNKLNFLVDDDLKYMIVGDFRLQTTHAFAFLDRLKADFETHFGDLEAFGSRFRDLRQYVDRSIELIQSYVPGVVRDADRIETIDVTHVLRRIDMPHSLPMTGPVLEVPLQRAGSDISIHISGGSQDVCSYVELAAVSMIKHLGKKLSESLWRVYHHHRQNIGKSVAGIIRGLFNKSKICYQFSEFCLLDQNSDPYGSDSSELKEIIDKTIQRFLRKRYGAGAQILPEKLEQAMAYLSTLVKWRNRHAHLFEERHRESSGGRHVMLYELDRLLMTDTLPRRFKSFAPILQLEVSSRLRDLEH